jgi:hypothetical protein
VRKYEDMSIWGSGDQVLEMKESVDRTFEVMGLMEELRDIWRKTSPLHNLSDEEKEKASSIIHRATELLKEIERDIWSNEKERNTT